ncbi:MAG: M23 family metallopeptidase [Chloroflexota bacterium]
MKKRKNPVYGLPVVWCGLWLLIAAACSPVAAPALVQPPAPTTPTPAPQITEAAPATASATRPAPAMPTPQPTTAATAAPTLPPPTFSNPLDAALAQTAETAGADFFVMDSANTGLWQYPQDTFIHPVALEMGEDAAYLLDAGRVLRLDVAEPMPAAVLLQPGDTVEGVTVIEPLDLYPAADGLLVLDRAGDVYRYDWDSGVWFLDRYDRPISDTSSHYYVALEGAGVDGVENGRYLLETSYNYVLLYENGEQRALWNLPEARGIDVAAAGEAAYVLAQRMDDTSATLTRYENTSKTETFRPNFPLDRARDVAATETAVYVLDQNGQRLLAFNPDSGSLQAVTQLLPDDPISAFALMPGAETILLAGRDRLYFWNQPQRAAHVPGAALLVGPQPHDPQVLASISGFAPPIGWELSPRDLQMPGAPRHYRLGVHEGADFYWARDSQVFAAADGVVIRALHDYTPPFPAAFAAMRAQAFELGYTSAEALDFYRGQQVWLHHENGLVSRYIHLGSIAWNIAEGDTVTQGQWIGTVGNSGSPASLESPDSDAHLHFELWLDDHYIGQFLRPVEIREWIEAILHDQP